MLEKTPCIVDRQSISRRCLLYNYSFFFSSQPPTFPTTLSPSFTLLPTPSSLFLPLPATAENKTRGPGTRDRDREPGPVPTLTRTGTGDRGPLPRGSLDAQGHDFLWSFFIPHLYHSHHPLSHSSQHLSTQKQHIYGTTKLAPHNTRPRDAPSCS